MNYNKVVSITGLGGLYEMVSSKADGAVVRSLEDNTTKFISNRQHSFSHLESIEVYTTNENTNLTAVFKKIKESSEKLPEEKADNKELKAYFEKVVPDLDFDRVYSSDMKKMVKWYNILTKNGIDFATIETDDNAPSADSAAKAIKHDASVKSGKPSKAAPRKIETRGGNRGT